jgi:hypothetical protein
MPFRLLLLTGLLLAACPASLAWAQDGDGDDAGDPALPEIAPREIEIRGRLEIAFPSLERQPLRGFNPPPLVPDLARSRTPFVERYKQERADLPQNLPEPPATADALGQPAPPLTGTLEASAGRYLTRVVAADLRLPVSGTESLLLRADYRGSDGFQAFDELDGVETPFDTFTGRLGFRSQRARTTVEAGAYGFLDRYRLVGARRSQPARVERPDRTGQQLGVDARLAYDGGATTFAFDAGFATTAYATSDTLAFAAEPEAREQRFRAGGRLALPLGDALAVELVADAEIATLTGPDPAAGGDAPEGDAAQVSGGADVRLVQTDALTATLGARALVGTASRTVAGATDDATDTYAAPVADVRWRPAGALTLYTTSRPGVDANALADLHAANPFVGVFPVVRPTVRVIDQEAGLRVATGPVEVTARGGYVWAPAFQYVAGLQPEGVTGVEGFFAPAYGEARIVRGGLDLAVQGLGPVQASFSVTGQQARLIDRDDADVPYLPAVLGHAVFSYSFAGQRGLAQLTATVEGPRPVDLAGSDDAPTFADVDTRVEYMITPRLGAVVRLENLGAVERWPDYPQPPAVATLGLRMRW